MSGKNANIGDTPGKVGNVRTYVRNGKVYTRSTTIVRKKSPKEMRPPRDLMRARLLQNWVTKMWLVVKGASLGLWEDKRPGSLDMHRFRSANRKNGYGVYLRKDEVMFTQVAAPLQISFGSLMEIGHSEDEDGSFVTNIDLRGLELTPETSINEFTCALMGTSDWEEGDELRLVVLAQEMEGDVPRCQTNTYGVTLRRGDELKVGNFFPSAFWSQKEGFLSTTNELPDCCFAFIHTRKKESGDMLTSTQVLQNHNKQIVDQYLSEEKFLEAAETYGGLRHTFIFGDN